MSDRHRRNTQTGDELFIDFPDAKVDNKLQFAFHVAFGEPGVINGAAVIETLQSMADLVENLASNFAPLLL